MPNEQQSHSRPTAEALPVAIDHRRENELRYKTIAVRVDEQLHAQLQFIAQLGGTSISEEIRQAIEGRITSAQKDPALIERAQKAHAEIEREAAARSAALVGFIGHQATAAATRHPIPERPTSKPLPQQGQRGAGSSR